jgi:predicted TIM-barrel fold metal-dependent hydrolase
VRYNYPDVTSSVYEGNLSMNESRLTRRGFLAASAAAATGVALAQTVRGAEASTAQASTAQAASRPVEEIIDIHQHTNYWGRSDAALFHHQKVMGVTQTILQPAGTAVVGKSTLQGKANGLQAGAGGVETCVPIVEAHPGAYFYAANEVPDLDGAVKTIEKYLKAGAVGIGEQKFDLPCDSKEMQAIYELAGVYGVPVLLHFQHATYNTDIARFEAMLKKYPKTNFVGHAQTLWANIDAKCKQDVLYPRGKVTPGGLTDRYLSDYPNMWADMSAGSGLNAMTRDEEHARGFIERHQDRLVYGSDCPDPAGHGPTCTGASQIAAIRRLSPSREVVRKLLCDNARRLYKLSALG